MKDNQQKALIGAGFAAAAAAAYFFLGPDGKKHRKKMKGWMVQMKGEVLERLEDAREVTEPVYNEIVDGVAETYSVAGKVPKSEILALAKDLKRHWKNITSSSEKRPARRRSLKKKTKKSK